VVAGFSPTNAPASPPYPPAPPREAALKQSYETAFATEAGRIALADICRKAGLHVAMSGPAENERTEAFLAGKRALAFQILKAAGMDTDRLPEALMRNRLEEMNDERRTEPDPRRSERGSGPRERRGPAADPVGDIDLGDV
jgi:hypothetical protein